MKEDTVAQFAEPFLNFPGGKDGGKLLNRHSEHQVYGNMFEPKLIRIGSSRARQFIPTCICHRTAHFYYVNSSAKSIRDSSFV